LQVIDSVSVFAKFRYDKEQRNFGGLSGELNGLTAELQRNLSVRRKCPAEPVPALGDIGLSDNTGQRLQVIDRT